MEAGRLNLRDTTKKVISSLEDYKSQAQRYKELLEKAYVMDSRENGSFTSQIDDFATEYHHRIEELQSLLSQIEGPATSASAIGHGIAQSLSTVRAAFNKVQPFVKKLEEDIVHISHLAKWAGKIDPVASPIKCSYKSARVGESSHAMPPLMLILKLTANSDVQDSFMETLEKTMRDYVPVQNMNDPVKAAMSSIQDTSSTITSSLQEYHSVLKVLHELQVGRYQFKHENKKTEKMETIHNHFFTDELVQQAIKLGNDLST